MVKQIKKSRYSFNLDEYSAKKVRDFAKKDRRTAKETLAIMIEEYKKGEQS